MANLGSGFEEFLIAQGGGASTPQNAQQSQAAFATPTPSGTAVVPNWGVGMGVPNSPMGVSNSQTGFPNSPMGLPNSQTGFPSSQMGLPNSQAGFPSSQMGVPNSQTGFPSSQMGLPNAQTGFPSSQMGVPNAQTGFPSSQMGVPNSQTGFPSSQMGVPNSQTGFPSSQMGVPNSQTGFPSSQMGVPNAQTGFPSSQMGVPNSQTGFPSSQIGVPNAKTGFPSSQSQMGFPNSQTGFPSSQTGFPSSQTGFPSSQTGFPSSQMAVSNSPTGVPNPNAPVGFSNSTFGIPDSTFEALKSPTSQSNSGIDVGLLDFLSAQDGSTATSQLAHQQTVVEAIPAVSDPPRAAPVVSTAPWPPVVPEPVPVQPRVEQDPGIARASNVSSTAPSPPAVPSDVQPPQSCFAEQAIQSTTTTTLGVGQIEASEPITDPTLKEIQARFGGLWRMVRSDPYDEYLKAVGIGLLNRKLASKAYPEQMVNVSGDKIYISLHSTFYNQNYIFKLNKETMNLVEKEQQEVFCSYKDGQLTLQMTPVNQGFAKVQEVVRSINDRGEHVVIYQCGKATCRRYFQRLSVYNNMNVKNNN